MLIEFSVCNYRSIKDIQVFSMVAAKDATHADTHVIQTNIKTPPEVLKSAVIYGANASGKSNFIDSIIFFRGLVVESATEIQLGQTFRLKPFLLDSANLEEPSHFEITFLDEGIRYQYGFSATKDRIHQEWLLVHKKSKPQEWFFRNYNKKTDQDEFVFGTHFTGQKKLWEKSTRPNGLFLSTAVQLNCEQLKPIFNWIANNIIAIAQNMQFLADFSIRMLQNKEDKKDIEAFISSADIGITNIEVVKMKGRSGKINIDVNTGTTTNFVNQETDLLSPKFQHKTDTGSVNFEYEDESSGTQKLFCLAGPVLDIIRNGRVLIIDEIDTSLHTLITKQLIKMFHDPKINSKGAQLIFTTHNTTLLDKDIFRRDQIWFVEKDRNQATSIYPLTDFSPRKNEALESGYLMGRYGAIPFLSDSSL